MRQKDRRQKRVHSVSSFCFVVFRPQSLLDILESQVMKRMSINHCVEVDAYIHGNVSRVQITSTDISENGRRPVSPSSTIGCESSSSPTQDKRKDISKFADVLFRILTSLLIVSQISFECDCHFRPFYGVGQSLRYIYARSNQRSSLSIRHLQKF